MAPDRTAMSEARISRLPRHPLHRAALFALVGIIAWYLTQVRFDLTTAGHGRSLEELRTGVALLPAAYRVLVPWLVNAAYQLITAVGGQQFATPDTTRALFFGLEVIAHVGAWLAFTALLARYFDPRQHPVYLYGLSLLIVLPFNSSLPRPVPIYYPYDTTALVFFTTGLLLIRQQRWAWYYPLFVLATLNRETSAALTVVYLLVAFRDTPPRILAAHIGAQAAIWLGIRAALHTLYGGNAGDPLWYFLDLNLFSLLVPYSLTTVLSSSGFLWLLAFVYWRRIPDEFTRMAMLVIIPIFLGMMIVGLIYEIRIFLEFSALPLLAAWLLVAQRFGWSPAPD